ncbi:MAG: Gfo/Idh/MocA family protein [Alphaproteobacteria bacterium]
MSRTNVAIIGLGMAVKPHALALSELAERGVVEVSHAYSPTLERREAFTRTYGFPGAPDLETILDDSSVEAVLLLTPPNTHRDLVARCAAAGKHVLLEKPVELDLSRAQATVAACREAGVKLGVVLQHRFRAPSERLAQIITSGGLGEVIGASANIRNWRPQSYYDVPGRGTYARDGGGVMLTQAIHTLDVLVSLAGLPAEVSAFARTTPVHQMEAEDLVAASIRFSNDALGTIGATTTAHPGFPDRVDIIGEKGSATIEGWELRVDYSDGTEERIEPGGGQGGFGADPMDFSPDQHRDLIEDFLTAVRTGAEPRVSGAEALKVHVLIDGLTRAAETGTRVRLDI